jgi:ATP/maltotriose-dependent transcriptional regulator MalT
MQRTVKRGITEANHQPILDAVKEMPCHEDFEPGYARVRRLFLRRWYHTRSKRVQTVSLEECLEDEGHGIFEIQDVSASFEDSVAAADFAQRFTVQLSQRDWEILHLRLYGYTYEKIAKLLGYSNHSGVIKRMAAVQKAFVQYENEQP